MRTPNPCELKTYTLNQRRPKPGPKVMLTVKDSAGPYFLNFPCEWTGQEFVSSRSRSPLGVEVIAWRPVNVLDRMKPYKPSRLLMNDAQMRYV